MDNQVTDDQLAYLMRVVGEKIDTSTALPRPGNCDDDDDDDSSDRGLHFGAILSACDGCQASLSGTVFSRNCLECAYRKLLADVNAHRRASRDFPYGHCKVASADETWACVFDPKNRLHQAEVVTFSLVASNFIQTGEFILPNLTYHVLEHVLEIGEYDTAQLYFSGAKVRDAFETERLFDVCVKHAGVATLPDAFLRFLVSVKSGVFVWRLLRRIATPADFMNTTLWQNYRRAMLLVPRISSKAIRCKLANTLWKYCNSHLAPSKEDVLSMCICAQVCLRNQLLLADGGSVGAPPDKFYLPTPENFARFYDVMMVTLPHTECFDVNTRRHFYGADIRVCVPRYLVFLLLARETARRLQCCGNDTFFALLDPLFIVSHLSRFCFYTAVFSPTLLMRHFLPIDSVREGAFIDSADVAAICTQLALYLNTSNWFVTNALRESDVAKYLANPEAVAPFFYTFGSNPFLFPAIDESYDAMWRDVGGVVLPTDLSVVPMNE